MSETENWHDSMFKTIDEEIEFYKLKIKTISEHSDNKLVAEWYINLYKKDIERLQNKKLETENKRKKFKILEFIKSNKEGEKSE